MIKKETIRLTMAFEIEYDSSIPRARDMVVKKIQPYFERTGHSWVIGEWAIRQKAKRIINTLE